MIFFVLFLMFTLIPVAEIYVLVQAAHVIGTWSTLGLVVLSGFVGSWFVRSQSYSIIQKINRTVSQGQLPAEDLMSGFCVLVGGILMIAPGFITDVMGLLLVLPPTRVVIVWGLKKYFAQMVRRGRVKVWNVQTNQRYTSWPLRDVGPLKLDGPVSNLSDDPNAERRSPDQHP